jgi:succinoglycan biosynthesis transport protein ExoP
MIAELQEESDLVIVDSPAALAVGDTAAIARSVDGLVLLADLTRAKRPLLEEAARQIRQMPCRKVGLVVVSDVRSERYAHHYAYDLPDEPLQGTTGGNGSRSRLRTRSRVEAEGPQPVPNRVDGA